MGEEEARTQAVDGGVYSMVLRWLCVRGIATSDTMLYLIGRTTY